jgi:hypothetical protein
MRKWYDANWDLIGEQKRQSLRRALEKVQDFLSGWAMLGVKEQSKIYKYFISIYQVFTLYSNIGTPLLSGLCF